MRKFLASEVGCAPDACSQDRDGCVYQIAWKLNPHMMVGSANHLRARAQHARLIRTVRDLGAQVDLLPFVHGAFDSVFAKDNGVYTSTRGGLRAVLARPRHPERQAEQKPRARELRGCGAVVAHVEHGFEGGDFVLDPTRRVGFLGTGFRSSPEAAPHLARQLGMHVVPLELVDPVLYHLDTALAVLEDGTAMYCEEAFSSASQRLLRDSFECAIVVSREDATAFALNFVEVGDTVVTGTDANAVTAVLRGLRKRVIVLELDEFQRSGGSAACLLGPVLDVTDARRLNASYAHAV